MRRSDLLVLASVVAVAVAFAAYVSVGPPPARSGLPGIFEVLGPAGLLLGLGLLGLGLLLGRRRR